MRRTFREILMTIGTLTILMIVLAVADVRVREKVTRNTLTQTSAEAASVVAKARRGTQTIVMIAREETRSHTLLVGFAVAATVLVVFMLRT